MPDADTLAAPRYRGAIWTLIILAPVIAEVLSGSTRVSFLFVLLPEMMVWGCGALLARELVRRWRGGGLSLLLLGFALSIAEECLIQQTSLAPLPWPGANAAYGRYFGVNWVYFLFMFVFESVWVVVVPVQITELLFPSRRRTPWLRARGLIVNCIVFPVGCFLAWFGWTQSALKQMHVAPYHPPVAAFALAVAAILLLFLAAYLLRRTAHAAVLPSRSAVSPWLCLVLAFLLAEPWWALLSLIFTPHAALPASVPLATGIVWAAVAFLVVRSLSSAGNWQDSHRWALSTGVILSGMTAPYLSFSTWLLVDKVGIVVLHVAALVFLALLGRTAFRRSVAKPAPTPS